MEDNKLKKKLHVGQLYVPSFEDFNDVIDQISKTKYYTNNGPLLQELERELAIYLGVNYVLAVTNGTIGLMIALEALHKEGSILTPRFSFPATMNAISMIGANLFYCDTLRYSPNVCLESLEEKLINNKTISTVLIPNLWSTVKALTFPPFFCTHSLPNKHKAMLSLPATKGFEVGSGFSGTLLKGSEHNDLFEKREGSIRAVTNRSGGVQGGISNGEELYFRTAFKPTATVLQEQQTVDLEGNETVLMGRGRHDPCVLPRAVPIVEAMTALVLVDHWLRHQGQCGSFDFNSLTD